MIQTGDPLGTGSGDAGYKFKDEINDLMKLSFAWQITALQTNSSQFFITHVATPWLDGSIPFWACGRRRNERGEPHRTKRLYQKKL
jgi:cyclophilin family peptidyl-prolyl cis-trans isomerase